MKKSTLFIPVIVVLLFTPIFYGFNVGAQVPDLGTNWCEVEPQEIPQGAYYGSWIRRGLTNIFDASWIQAGTTNVYTAEVRMVQSGNDITMSSYSSTGSLLCNYTGTFSDSTNVGGTYSCGGSGFSWYAVVNGDCILPPTCDASFTPDIINSSESSILAWSTTRDADEIIEYSCSGDIGTGGTTPSGSSTVNPLTSQTCTFIAANAIGTKTCSASITVLQLPDYIANGLATSPGNLVAGQQVTFAATARNTGFSIGALSSAVRLRLDINNDGTYDQTFGNQTVGSLAVGSSQVVNWSNAWITVPGVHKFEVCADVGGAILESNEINNCTTQVFSVIAPPPSCSINFSPAVITTGQSTTQAWSSSNDADGILQYSCSGNLGSSNISASGSGTVSPSSTQSCTLTAVNASGVSTTCSGSVTVNPPVNQLPVVSSITHDGTDVAPGIPGIQFYTGSTINYSATASDPDGDPLTWTWYYTINGGARISFLSGTGAIQPATFTYPTAGISYQWIISVSDGRGGIVEQTLNVQIIAQPTPTPVPPPPAPSASILCNGLLDSCNITAGSPVTISWNCFNSSAGTVTNSLDSTTWSNISDSQLVNSLSTSTTYFLSCGGAGGTATAIVSVYIIQSVPPPPGPQADFFGLDIPNPFGNQLDTFDQLFGVIILFLYYLAAPIVVIMIILAGLLFLIGRGDPNKVQTAKKILLYAIIGLVIILIGRGFIELLESIFALGTPN